MNGITNGLLFQWHTEIQNLQNSVIAFLLKGRLQDFYKEYAIRIDTLLVKREKLQREYFEFEEKNIKMAENEAKEQKPVMLEGKTYEDYLTAYTVLMNEPISQIKVPLKDSLKIIN